jgi:hypothetical protein
MNMDRWGITLLGAGVLGYFITGNYLSRFETSWGRLAVALGGEAASQYQLWKFANIASAVMALIGIILIILVAYRTYKS